MNVTTTYHNYLNLKISITLVYKWDDYEQKKNINLCDVKNQESFLGSLWTSTSFGKFYEQMLNSLMLTPLCQNLVKDDHLL